MMIKRLTYIISMMALILTVSCDEHRDFPPSGIQIGQVLCTDGTLVRSEHIDSLGKTPIGVVFRINQEDDVEGDAFAVYLYDVPASQFADTLGVSQGTSCSLTAYDGNTNTYNLYKNSQAPSPMSQYVFSMWKYGQSAYIPSIAQLASLRSVKTKVNSVLSSIGGTPLPDYADKSWLWSSTEVEGQADQKAWLYSMESGAIHETPKDQKHQIRPIITIYNR